MKLLFTFVALLVYAGVTAQVGIGTTTPNPNAVLELKSPGNNQGFLVPRLTTAQRNGLVLAAKDNGLLVFDSDDQKFYYWQNTQWLPIKSGNDVNLVAGAGIDITGNTISAVPDADGDAANEIQDLQLTGNILTITNNDNATPIDLSPLADADGDVTNEIQDLQLTGNTLKITNNASATAIDLSPFVDADGDPANEIQDLQLVGNTLSITNNAGATAIDLAPFAGTNTDNQTLSFNTTTGLLGITGGNSVTLNATGAATGDLSGSYPNPSIAANAVTSAKILDGAVGTGDLANTAVTTGKLADGAVTTVKINDGAVTGAKLENIIASPGSFGTATTVPQVGVDAHGRIISVTSVAISGVAPAGAASGDLTGSYPSPSIAANAVTSAKILDGTIASNDIADGSIATADVADAAVTTNKLNNLAVTTAKLADASVSTVKIADGAVTGAKLESIIASPGSFGAATTVPQVTVDAHGRITAVTPVTIAGVAPGGAAGGDLTGNYPSPTIAANAVTSAKILDGAVGTSDLTNLAVTTAKLNDAAVNTAKIADGSVTEAKINDGAVITNKLADGAVTGAKLESIIASPGSFGTATTVPQLGVDAHGRITSVTSVAISGIAPAGLAGGDLTGTYPSPTIAANAVTSAKILDGTIASTDIADGTIATADVADAAVTTNKLNNLAVTTAKLADASVSTVKISDGAVTGAKLESIIASTGSFGTATTVPQVTVDAHGRITAAASVTIAGVAPGGAAGGDLTGNYPSPTITANAVTSAKILDGTIASADIADGTIVSADIADGTVATADVADGAVTTVKLNNLAVTTAKLADGAVTNAKISGVDPSKITPSGVLGQVLTTTAVGTVWSNLPSLGGGTVTSVGTGTGLTGGPITGTGTISIASGGVTTTQIADGTIANADVSSTAAIAVSKLAGGSTDGQVLTSISGTPQWAAPPSTASALDVVLAKGNDAKDQDAKGFRSVTITNSGGDKITGSGALNVQGAHFMSFTEIVADYSVQPNDYIILCNPSKLVGVTLPKAGENKGRILMFQSTGTSSTQAMVLKSDDNIDGQPNSEILWIDPNFSANTAYAVTVMSTGTTWVTISRSIGRSKG